MPPRPTPSRAPTRWGNGRSVWTGAAASPGALAGLRNVRRDGHDSATPPPVAARLPALALEGPPSSLSSSFIALPVTPPDDARTRKLVSGFLAAILLACGAVVAFGKSPKLRAEAPPPGDVVVPLPVLDPQEKPRDEPPLPAAPANEEADEDDVELDEVEEPGSASPTPVVTAAVRPLPQVLPAPRPARVGAERSTPAPDAFD